jgi:hypothetical protein
MKIKFLLTFSILIFCSSCALSAGQGNGSAASAPGSILFQDDFSDPAGGWDHVSVDGGAMDYDNGVYRFLISTPHFNYWATPGKTYTDTRIEVDVAKLEGPDANRAGIVCRLTDEQFYFFVISSDGYYAVGRTNGLESVLLGQEQMMLSVNINTGMALNHLRADCAGNQLTFYINGFPVSKVTDATLTSGEVGLLAGTFDEGGVDIIFDQFVVMQP